MGGGFGGPFGDGGGLFAASSRAWAVRGRTVSGGLRAEQKSATKALVLAPWKSRSEKKPEENDGARETRGKKTHWDSSGLTCLSPAWPYKSGS
jgi:hypothetical protein